MEAIAVYDFEAKWPDELGFKKGNVLKIIVMEDDDNWFLAEFRGKEGLIPSAYVKIKMEDWYYGKFTRAQSAKFLEKQPNGCFVVRRSESIPGNFSLSVKCNAGVQHFKVLRNAQSKFYLWVMEFDSLNQLVEYHRTSSIYRSQNVTLRSMPSVPTVQKQIRRYPIVMIGIYDFNAQDDGELEFKKGQLITVLRCEDIHWWHGKIGAREGLFPVSYATIYRA